MSDRRHALTPDALQMMDTIARTGSFAAAARELGKVPSALTYSVRQLEDALDVLLFDRRSRQASLTAAGEELLREGRLLMQQMDAVANRVKRVASGWEAELTIAVDKVIAPHAIFDLIEGFYALKPPTRVRMLSEVMNGTWEALTSGAADLAIGIPGDRTPPAGIQLKDLGPLEFVFGDVAIFFCGLKRLAGIATHATQHDSPIFGKVLHHFDVFLTAVFGQRWKRQADDDAVIARIHPDVAGAQGFFDRTNRRPVVGFDYQQPRLRHLETGQLLQRHG